jgi:hypothetical protein
MNGFQNNFTALPIIITTDIVCILSPLDNVTATSSWQIWSQNDISSTPHHDTVIYINNKTQNLSWVIRTVSI